MFGLIRHRQIAAALFAVSLLLQSPTVWAQTNVVFTGGADDQWDNPTNWALGFLPGEVGFGGNPGDTTFITNIGTPLGDFDLDSDVDGADFLVWQRGGSPTPTSAGDLAVWEANFGASGGGVNPAIVDQTVPTFATAFVGQGPGDGIVRVVAGGALTASVRFSLGRDTSRSGTLDIQGGTFSTSQLAVGDSFDGSATTGTLLISGGSVTASSEFSIALADSDPSSVTQSGGAVTSNAILGIGNGGLGTYALSGGTLDVLGSVIQVGNHANSGGSSLTVSGGVLNAVNLNPGAFGKGTLNISGTADVNVSGLMQVGATPGAANSEINVLGGNFDVGGEVRVGVGGSGTFTQSGGTTSIDRFLVGKSSASTLNLTGGVINIPNTLSQITGFSVGDFAPGTANHSAGTINNTGNMAVGFASQGTYNLSGTGELNSNAIILALDSAGGNSVLNQSGGTIVTGVMQVGRLAVGTFDISAGSFTGTAIHVSTDDEGGGTPGSAGSSVVQSGGAVTISNGGGGVVSVGNKFQGSYAISGGSIQFDGMLEVLNGGTFNVVGDAGTITDTITGGLGLTVTNGTLDFDFNATGISKIDLSIGSLLTRNAATLDIDGSSYAGGAGTFTLIEHAGLGVGDAGFSTTLGLGSFVGFTAAIIETGTTVDLVLTAALGAGVSAIPEPSSLVLCLLAGTIGYLRRRR